MGKLGSELGHNAPRPKRRACVGPGVQQSTPRGSWLLYVPLVAIAHTPGFREPLHIHVSWPSAGQTAAEGEANGLGARI